MNITRDVVTDLLPVYFAGEASADSRSLVEEFFGTDPEFAKMARKLSGQRERIEIEAPVPDTQAEKETLQRTRAMLHGRNAWLVFGIAYVLAPFLAFPRHGHWWVLLRDNHFAAWFFFSFGLICCGIAVLFNWQARKTGL